MSYITKQDIELWFNNEVTLDNTLADDLITKNSAYVDHIAGTKFEPTQVVEEISLDKTTNVIYLTNFPVLSIEHIYVNQADEFNPDWQEITEFYIDSPEIGSIVLKKVIPAKRRALKVEYTYGYNQVPELVKKLVIDLCVLDVLRIMTNKKSYNDEGDVDLGTLKISGSFKYSLAKIEQLRKEIEQLKQALYGFKAIV